MNTDPNQEPVIDETLDSADQIAEQLVNATTEEEPSSEDTIESLRAEMEKASLLHQADMENFRKRSRTQMQDQLKYASLPLLTELLESVDNLNRATESAQVESDNSSLVQGVTMVATQLANLLEKHGCKKIQAVGQAFDPNCHQAVQMQPSEEYPANVVMHEIRTGFLLHDRVLRPAQVFVSTGPQTDEAAE